jgi:hypothetical protein
MVALVGMAAVAVALVALLLVLQQALVDWVGRGW